MLERINTLIVEAMRDSFRGTGKPEPLKRNLTGWCSRRITTEHRLVYRVRGAVRDTGVGRGAAGSGGGGVKMMIGQSRALSKAQLKTACVERDLVDYFTKLLASFV